MIDKEKYIWTPEIIICMFLFPILACVVYFTDYHINPCIPLCIGWVLGTQHTRKVLKIILKNNTKDAID